MKYTIREYGTELHIIAEEGLVSASISEWTSLRARRILGRDLKEGERFYWLNKIFNKSGKKGEGTELLQFVIDTLEKRNATIWLIADPDKDESRDLISQRILKVRLVEWYKRHGFKDTGSRHYSLVRLAPLLSNLDKSMRF